MPDLIVGWTLIATGLIARRGRPDSRVGLLLTASGFAWFLGNFDGVDTAWVAWIAGHGIHLHRGPLLHAILAFPTGRASRLDRGAVGVAYAAAFLTPVWGDEWITIGLVVAFVVVVVRRHAMAVAGERRARRTAMRLAVALGAVLAGGAIARLVYTGDSVEEASLLTYQAVLCLAAVGLANSLLSRPWEQTAVTDLVVELGEVAGRCGAQIESPASRLDRLADVARMLGRLLDDRADLR